MHVNIRGAGRAVSKDIREYIDRRLSFALSRFSNRVHRVAVYVGDLNGPKGGQDQWCHIVARLHTGTPLVIVDRDAQVTTLIDRAADRLGHAVSRRITRLRDVGRHAVVMEGAR